MGLILAVGLNFQVAFAQPIYTGLFTQNNLRQCSNDNAWIGGDPSLVIDRDYDLSPHAARRQEREDPYDRRKSDAWRYPTLSAR